MIKKLCFIFVVTLTFDVRARPFEVEKQEIDAYAYAYGLNYANQISSMYQYVFSVLRENTEDRYDQKILTHVLDFFDGKKDQVDKAVKDQHEFNILYGGCCLLKEFVELSNPQKIDVLGMAELCACLFSPELFALTEDPENAEYGIYRAAYRAQERVARISASYFDAEEKTEALFKKKYPYFRCNPSYVVTSSFLTPQILRGEAAVFSDKAFIYALSKGILLYGLSHQKNDVHGGLYKYPAYLFNHDQAHANDILRCGATSLRPKNTLIKNIKNYVIKL